MRIAQERSDRLADTLREARDQIVASREEVDCPPSHPAAAGLLSRHDDGTVDVFAASRKIRVTVSPTVDVDALQAGQEVMLNEAMNVVAACGFERQGEIVTLKEVLEDRGTRPSSDELMRRGSLLAALLLEGPLRAGDALLMEVRSGYVYERIPKAEVEELVLEEVP